MEQKKLLCLVVWRAVAWARAAFENRKKNGHRKANPRNCLQ